MSLTVNQLAQIGERKIFHELRRTPCPESGNQTFLGSGGRKLSLTANSSSRIGERKIFHELDVHHV